MARLAIALWAVLFSIFAPHPVFGDQQHDFSGEMFVDESGEAGLADVIGAEFVPFVGSIAEGYTDSALWIRLKVAGSDETESRVILVQPAFLSRIEFYDPSMNGLDAEPVVSGRDAPISPENHIGLDSSFLVPSSPNGRDVYLRVTTTTTLTASLRVLPANLATSHGFVTGGLVTAYIAFLISFGLWGLISWAIRHDGIYGLFAVRQIVASAHVFVWFGALRFFFSGSLSADTRELVYIIISCTVAPVAGYFDVRLISEFGGSRHLRRAILVVLAAPFVALFIALPDNPQLALKTCVLLINMQMLMLVALAFTAKGDRSQPLGDTSLRLVRAGYVMMCAVTIMPMLMFLNIIHTSVPLFKLVFLHPVLSTIVLFGLLLVRNLQRDLAEKEARILLGTKEAALREESSRRQEKERFLSMLTHELRNPLSVIQLLSGRESRFDATLRQATRDMAEVIDRVEQSERIGAGQLHVELSRFDLAALVATVAQVRGIELPAALGLSGPQMVFSDERLMRHILENLLDNATKYRAADTDIDVEIAASAVDGRAGVVIRISNVVGSSGVPDPDRLFAKYYRTKGAHRQPGSGLGLFLVSSWITALSGTVAFSVSDTADGLQAVTFSVWVPR